MSGGAYIKWVIFREIQPVNSPHLHLKNVAGLKIMEDFQFSGKIVMMVKSFWTNLLRLVRARLQPKMILKDGSLVHVALRNSRVKVNINVHEIALIDDSRLDAFLKCSELKSETLFQWLHS